MSTDTVAIHDLAFDPVVGRWIVDGVLVNAYASIAVGGAASHVHIGLLGALLHVALALRR